MAREFIQAKTVACNMLHIDRFAQTQRHRRFQKQDREAPIEKTSEEDADDVEGTSCKEKDNKKLLCGREEEKKSNHDGAARGPTLTVTCAGGD